MTTYPDMDIIVQDEACTMCVKCGTNTMLIEALPIITGDTAIIAGRPSALIRSRE
jgi:hypothetical protein